MQDLDWGSQVNLVFASWQEVRGEVAPDPLSLTLEGVFEFESLHGGKGTCTVPPTTSLREDARQALSPPSQKGKGK